MSEETRAKALPLLLAVAIAGAYAPSLGGGFLGYDDDDARGEHDRARELLLEVLTRTPRYARARRTYESMFGEPLVPPPPMLRFDPAITPSDAGSARGFGLVGGEREIRAVPREARSEAIHQHGARVDHRHRPGDEVERSWRVGHLATPSVLEGVVLGLEGLSERGRADVLDPEGDLLA